ncbi:MAG: ATP-binding protein [Nitrospirae bacterium]|nr:ATP-binding protein [Nitrospirota bacterium]
MYAASFFNHYRIGRFIFALALLIAFQIAGLPYAVPSLRNILIIYISIVLLRLFVTTKKINYFDFLLDIVFISAMVYISFGIYSFLTLIYLFPIFFSSFLIKTKKIFVFPAIAAILYSAVYYSYGIMFERESFLNISLHLFAFSLIALAGDNLKTRMEQQESYIKRLEEEKIKTQGLERLYRVSADLAHELRNPLASISAAVQFLNEGKTDRQFIDMLMTETKRLTSLVNDFLLFARPANAPREDVDLSEMLAEMLAALVNDQGSDKTITFTNAGNAVIRANRTFMELAVNNIIRNAVEAAQTAVTVRLWKTLSEIGIEVEDDGAGMNEDTRDKIFEPFFTTKPNGTGLGLAIAFRIITSFGGTLNAGTSPLGGAKFSIIFPIKT